MAFKPIRVKFKPSAKDVQVCEESGVDLAQAVHRAIRVAERQAGSSQVKTGTFAVAAVTAAAVYAAAAAAAAVLAGNSFECTHCCKCLTLASADADAAWSRIKALSLVT